jgi:hypothetical protein
MISEPIAGTSLRELGDQVAERWTTLLGCDDCESPRRWSGSEVVEQEPFGATYGDEREKKHC